MFPMSHAEVVAAFLAKIREVKQLHSNIQFSILPGDKSLAPTGNRFVAIIDSIASTPGVLMPWKELVDVCKEEGVWSVIDAAHSVGQEVGTGLWSLHDHERELTEIFA